MSDILPTELRRALTEQLAGSLTGPIPEGTPRRVFGATGVAGKATSVVGMRRAGKTTYLHQLRRERWEAGAPRESLVYVNFEDERLVELRGEQLGFLVNEYRRRFPEVADRHTTPLWCFDEIQVVPGWERFVRRMLDAGDCDVIVTGSSAALLSREIATALRGRG